MSVFWAAGVSPDLSPGDLLVDAIVGATAVPPVPLKSKSFRGNESGWAQVAWSPDGDGRGHFLATGRKTAVMVLSHGCEIDKNGGKAPVLVAPAFPIASLPPEHQAVARNGERFAFLPIPEIAGQVPESFVDLRLVTYLPRTLIDNLSRVASASEQGQARLAAQLVGFLTRINISTLSSRQEG